jgi:hypothetical protein
MRTKERTSKQEHSWSCYDMGAFISSKLGRRLIM